MTSMNSREEVVDQHSMNLLQRNWWEKSSSLGNKLDYGLGGRGGQQREHLKLSGVDV